MEFHKLIGNSSFSILWFLVPFAATTILPPSSRPHPLIRDVFRWAASLASIIPIAVISCCSESQANVQSCVGDWPSDGSRVSILNEIHIMLLQCLTFCLASSRVYRGDHLRSTSSLCTSTGVPSLGNRCHLNLPDVVCLLSSYRCSEHVAPFPSV